MGHARNFKDRTGIKVGRLTFLKYLETNHRGNAVWLVRCDCGEEFPVVANMVKPGNTLSCGCLRVDIQKNKRKP